MRVFQGLALGGHALWLYPGSVTHEHPYSPYCTSFEVHDSGSCNGYRMVYTFVFVVWIWSLTQLMRGSQILSSQRNWNTIVHPLLSPKLLTIKPEKCSVTPLGRCKRLGRSRAGPRATSASDWARPRSVSDSWSLGCPNTQTSADTLSRGSRLALG